MPERFVATRLRNLLGLASVSALASLQSARAQDVAASPPDESQSMYAELQLATAGDVSGNPAAQGDETSVNGERSRLRTDYRP